MLTEDITGEEGEDSEGETYGEEDDGDLNDALFVGQGFRGRQSKRGERKQEREDVSIKENIDSIP